MRLLHPELAKSRLGAAKPPLVLTQCRIALLYIAKMPLPLSGRRGIFLESPRISFTIDYNIHKDRGLNEVWDLRMAITIDRVRC